jgi:hypothetical protein
VIAILPERFALSRAPSPVKAWRACGQALRIKQHARQIARKRKGVEACSVRHALDRRLPAGIVCVKPA